jgi:hypothetical protein
VFEAWRTKSFGRVYLILGVEADCEPGVRRREFPRTHNGENRVLDRQSQSEQGRTGTSKR